MSHVETTGARYPIPPLYWADERRDEYLRQIATSVRGLLVGETNNALVLALDPNVTTTAHSDTRIAAHMIPLLVPMSALAATAVGAGVVYVTVKSGELKVHHDSDPSTDRVFGIVFLG